MMGANWQMCASYLNFHSSKVTGTLFEVTVLDLHVADGLTVLWRWQATLAKEKGFFKEFNFGSQIAARLANLCENSDSGYGGMTCWDVNGGFGEFTTVLSFSQKFSQKRCAEKAPSHAVTMLLLHQCFIYIPTFEK